MFIGILSDTHENLPLIKKAVKCFNDRKVALVLHAGDFVSPFTSREFSKLSMHLIGVFGNNDGERKLWKDNVAGWGEIHESPYEFKYENYNILLRHEPYGLEDAIKSQKYDIIVYGHTHKPDDRLSGRTLVVNPGECGGWLTGRSTVAIVELPQKKAEIISL